MAVIRVALKELSKGSATSEPNGLLYEIVRRKYTAVFIVHTNNFRDTQPTILGYASLPQVGESYNFFGVTDAVATCVSGECEKVSPKVWLYTAEFDTDRVVSAVTDNPLNQPADIDYQAIQVERPAIRDQSGLLIKNSSGESYDPPVMETVKLTQVSITQNLATFDQGEAQKFVDSVNELEWRDNAGYSVKVVDRKGQRQISRGIFYYQVTTILEFNPRSYGEFVLDQGYRDKNNALIRDPLDNSTPANPTLLNGRGWPLRYGVLPLATAMNDSQTNATHNNAGEVVWRFPPPVTIVDDRLVPPHWFFFIRIDNEVMRVTGITMTDFAVDRGYAGTTAAAHLVGAQMILEPYFLFYRTKAERNLDDLNLPTF